MTTLYEDEDIIVSVQTHDSYPNEVFIHCEVLNWSISKYRRFLTIWTAILDELYAVGCTRINTIIPKNDMKTRRFQTMFGLAPKAETESAVWYSMEV